MNHDVAIVGMGCRFPQAADLGAYWQNICDARVCFSDIPSERWNHALFYDASPRAIDKTYARKVGLLDDVRSFAALHYGLAPLRVSVMDPQHRLLLDAVRVAFEDAGLSEQALAGTRTAVFVGASVSEYKDLITSRLRVRALLDGQFGRAPTLSPKVIDALVEDVTPLRAFTIAGNLLNMAAATISQTFDLRGPAFTIDAACSSSMVAAYDAVLHLRAGVCDMAIAGGVYLNLTPDNLVGFSRIGAISPSDACRPFDERADGFVMGEGAGAIVLKRLADALRDGDRIYAVIRGAGINNDGRGEGPMTPRPEGQLDAIGCAHAELDFSPNTIGFVEAHGTATAVGDATEVGALRQYFDAHGVGPIDCALSSVKANIGHTMSAAGVAGLLKAALVLERATIPAQAAFMRAHDKLGLAGSGFYVPTKTAPFPVKDGQPRRAAVSSFGFGGTNCHLVLEEAPLRVRRSATIAVPAMKLPAEAFLVSAPTVGLLAGHLDQLHASIAEREPLADIAYTLARRARHEARVGFIARTHDELRAKLDTARMIVRGGTQQAGIWFRAAPLAEAERRIAFLFPGQGAQTIGMCHALYDRFPGFRGRLDAIAAELDDLLDRPLLSYLYPKRRCGVVVDDAAELHALTATEVCQPTMAALGLAVAGFVEELGVVPAIVAGHSLGEFAALGAAGRMSLRDTVRFVAQRGHLMGVLPLVDRGAMAAVQADRRFVEAQLDAAGEVVIANVNQPKQTVIAGATDAVIGVSARLAAAGVTVTRLAVSHAFHSPLIALADPPIGELVDALVIHAGDRVAISCIEPGPYADDADVVRGTMRRHATAPVDFIMGMRAAAHAGARIFVQVVAGTSLLSMARASLRAVDLTPIATIALTDLGDDGAQLVAAMVELAVLGVPVRLAALHDGTRSRTTWLPPTPLPTEPYWCATRGDRSIPLPPVAGGGTAGSDDTVTLLREHLKLIQTHLDTLTRSTVPQTIRAEVATPAAPEVVARVPLASPPVVVTSPIVAAISHAEPFVPIASKLLELVAQVSAFPQDKLNPTQRLVSDLGFDSLMVVELSGKLADAFPTFKGLPKTLFAGEPTIGDVTQYVENAMRGSIHTSTPTDTVEISRYAAIAVARPGTPLPYGAIPPFEGPIAIFANSSDVGRQLASRLAAVGVAAELVERLLARHRGVIDLRAVRSTSRDALTLEAAELRVPFDRAFDVAAALGDRPTLFAVAYTGDEGAAVAGFAKALAREWPTTRVKAIALAARTSADQIASQIFDELVATDTTVEVTYASGTREVIELRLVTTDTQRRLRDGAVVAISGGARGLGAKLAVALASRHHARLILLGRGACGDELLAAIAAAGGQALHVHCDVRDAAAVATALDAGRRRFGPIEAVIHAAGVIADAPVAKKDRTAMAAVFDTKVAGWIALERATRNDPVQIMLALGSWSGRFGNAEQTDYSAANHLVATLAAAWGRARPSVRLVALDLPPWDGTAMASTIPAGLRAVMRARGVSFLDDATGLDVVLGELEATGESAEVLIGHDVAIEREHRLRIRIGLATHPFLGDHRIGGVPVLPLAAAADLLATIAGRMMATCGLAELELIAGVRLERDLPVEVDLRASCEQRGDAVGAIDLELATAGQLAYRAVAITPSAPLPELAMPASLAPPDLALDAFYTHHTFHGPRLRGIEEIAGLDARNLVGTVRSARPGDLCPNAAFAIDPLVLDASFQLAAYLMFARHNRAGLPLGFDELRVLAPVAPGTRVTCLVRFEESAADLVIGHIDYRDASGSLILQLRGVRGQFRVVEPPKERRLNGHTANGVATNGHATNGHDRSTAEPPTPSSVSDEIDPASYDIARFPETVALRARIADVEASGLEIPYFNLHERITGDTTVIAGREVINFSAYNYLGLSGDPAVSRAAIAAIERYGTSVSASRIASGEKPLHRELEGALARFLGCEDAIVMVSGHATNVSVVGHLVGPGDLVLHDSLAHDSILGGIKLSGARRRPFPHNDWRALDAALVSMRGAFRRVLIVIEGVYSMDGDIPDLPKFVEIKRRHKALLMIDEAHSLGVLGARGAGIGEQFEVDRREIDVWMGTLSKSLASCGGYIAGSHALVEYLKYTNPGFVYSVGISPPNAAAALAALHELQRRPELVTTLRSRAALFLALCRDRGIDTGLSAGSAVVPCIVGDSVRCMLISQALAQTGINVQPIIYPAVEEQLSRLRFFITARHTERQLRYAADTLAQIHTTFNRSRVRPKPSEESHAADTR